MENHRHAAGRRGRNATQTQSRHHAPHTPASGSGEVLLTFGCIGELSASFVLIALLLLALVALTHGTIDVEAPSADRYEERRKSSGILGVADIAMVQTVPNRGCTATAVCPKPKQSGGMCNGGDPRKISASMAATQATARTTARQATQQRRQQHKDNVTRQRR